jgi:hypothetical protein
MYAQKHAQSQWVSLQLINICLKTKYYVDKLKACSKTCFVRQSPKHVRTKE